MTAAGDTAREAGKHTVDVTSSRPSQLAGRRLQEELEVRHRAEQEELEAGGPGGQHGRFGRRRGVGAGQRGRERTGRYASPGLPWGLIIGAGLLGAALGWPRRPPRGPRSSVRPRPRSSSWPRPRSWSPPGTTADYRSRSGSGRRPGPFAARRPYSAVMTDAVFFTTVAELRAWYEENHAEAPELFVGYWKKHTGKPGISHTEAIEQALCFGWIDSIGRRDRRGPAPGALHAAPQGQRVERGEHRGCGAPHRTGADAAGRAARVRDPATRSGGDLLVRAAR